MTKFQQVFQDMLNKNQTAFDEFRRVHDLYSEDPQKYQKQFDEVGRNIQDIIRRYENILCGKSEGTGYGKFSTKLAEKFQEQVRKTFPKIDCIGLEIH